MSVYVFVLKERIIPSFETETYETSFIKFDYPASWFEQSFDYNFVLFAKSNRPDLDAFDLSDPQQPEEARKYSELSLILITAARLDIYNRNAKNNNEAKAMYIDFSEQKMETEIYNDIGVMEVKLLPSEITIIINKKQDTLYNMSNKITYNTMDGYYCL